MLYQFWTYCREYLIREYLINIWIDIWITFKKTEPLNTSRLGKEIEKENGFIPSERKKNTEQMLLLVAREIY